MTIILELPTMTKKGSGVTPEISIIFELENQTVCLLMSIMHFTTRKQNANIFYF